MLHLLRARPLKPRHSQRIIKSASRARSQQQLRLPVVFKEVVVVCWGQVCMGFDEDKIGYLLHFGWDLLGDNKHPLQITPNVCRVIEAVARGIAGKAPEADVVDTEHWAEEMQRQADQFKRKKREGGNKS
jgi:hypothetical protein